MSHPRSLVADVGGTNTRVAFCEGRHLLTDSIERFRNSEFPGIEPILERYLQDKDVTPQAVCVDIAGPVRGDTGHVTNLDWHISHAGLCQATGAQTADILNDMQAQGHAVPYLEPHSYCTLLKGSIPPEGNTRLVINVGTGLNASIVLYINGQTVVPPAEAGHISLQARNDEEMRLLRWIEDQHGVVGLEDILSGRGFERLHAWICHDEGQGTPLSAAEILSAYQAHDAQAQRCLGLFTRFLGRYAGDLALITLPYAGIYLVGGVMQHLGKHLVQAGFEQAFTDKGRFGDHVRQYTLHLVTDDYAALCGCASHLEEISAG
ncbi:MAG: glucokinase [Pelagimonas sp.]|jgi:glucokinase|nr:glucokinase [Pelagimonas sp.]